MVATSIVSNGWFPKHSRGNAVFDERVERFVLRRKTFSFERRRRFAQGTDEIEIRDGPEAYGDRRIPWDRRNGECVTEADEDVSCLEVAGCQRQPVRRIGITQIDRKSHDQTTLIAHEKAEESIGDATRAIEFITGRRGSHRSRNRSNNTAVDRRRRARRIDTYRCAFACGGSLHAERNDENQCREYCKRKSAEVESHARG